MKLEIRTTQVWEGDLLTLSETEVIGDVPTMAIKISEDSMMGTKTFAFINKEQAELIINHLKQQFEL